MASKALNKTAQEKKWRAFIDNVPYIIIVTNQDGTIEFINHTIKGLSVKDVIGKKVYDFIPPEYHSIVKKAHAYVFRTGKITHYRTKGTGTNKTIAYYETNIGPVKGAGKITHAILSTTDITDRKKAEEALKLSETKYRTLVEQIPGMVYRGKSDWSVEILGKEVEAITGFAKRRFDTKKINWTKLIHPADKEKVMKEAAVLDEKECSIVQEYRIIKKDKTVAWVKDFKKSFHSNGKMHRVDGVVFDITLQKKAEKEKEKLQQKLKQYAKSLEIKLKSYEARRVKLTENEKLVFYGMARYPELSDEKLSKKIKVKRSTITAIKNKLKKQNLFKQVYIPNMPALGCELLSFIHIKFIMSHAKRQNIYKKYLGTSLNPAPAVYLHSTDDENICVTIAKNLVEFQKKYDFLQSMFLKNNILASDPKVIHVPFGASKINSFFDFSLFLNDLFELGKKNQIVPEAKKPTRKLSKNEKTILYGLVKYPNLSNTQLAKKTRLTQITIAKIKKKMIEEGFVKPAVIPNVKKLGCEFLALRISKDTAHASNSFIDLRQVNQAIMVNIYKDAGIDDSEGSVYTSEIQKTKEIRVEFAPVVKEILEIQDDF